MQKGYRSADARPMFFEKELFYYKLTVASDIQKGLLLVSFVAVGNYCRGMLKKAFLFRFALHELKKTPLSRIKKIFISRNFTNFTQSHFFYAQKLLLHVPFFAVRKKFPFSQTKRFSFAESFTNCPQKPPFSRTKSRLFAQTFPIPTQNNSFLPSISHFNVP